MTGGSSSPREPITRRVFPAFSTSFFFHAVINPSLSVAPPTRLNFSSRNEVVSLLKVSTLPPRAWLRATFISVNQSGARKRTGKLGFALVGFTYVSDRIDMFVGGC